MRSPCLVCLLVGLTAGIYRTGAAEDETFTEPAIAEIGAVKTLASDKAVVRDVVYGLEEENTRLYLTSQPLNGEDRRVLRSELKFDVPKGGRVVALSLAKMDNKNLMAVVKLKNGEELEFHCLTFIGPWGGGHIRDRHSYFQAKFYTTRNEIHVLAMGGRVGAMVILGQLTGNEDDLIGNGVFFFSGCPWPPEPGNLARLRATEFTRDRD